MSDIQYPVGTKAPWLNTALAGLHHALFAGLSIIILRQVFHLGEISENVSTTLFQVSFLAMGVAFFLQLIGNFSIGSGYVIPTVYSVVFLRGSILAIQEGGIALLGGMILFVGVIQLLMAYFFDYLRKYLPPLFGAIIILAVGIEAGVVGVEGIFSLTGPERNLGLNTWSYAFPGIVTLVLIISLNIWGRGLWRTVSIWFGLVGGTLVGQWTNSHAFAQSFQNISESIIDGIQWRWMGLEWNYNLAISFIIAAIASQYMTLEALRDAHLLNEPDALSVSTEKQKSTLKANGLANAICGLFGLSGMTGSPTRVALCETMSISTRASGVYAGVILCLMAFVPFLGRLFFAIPASVMGAFFVYMSAMLISKGFKQISLIRLDLRRSILLGLSLVAAMCVLLFPARAAELPIWLQPFFRTMLCASISTAMFLNIFFSFKRTQQLVVAIDLSQWNSVIQNIEKRLNEWEVSSLMIARSGKDLKNLEGVLKSVNARNIILNVSADDTYLGIQLYYNGSMITLPETSLADHIGVETTGLRQKLVLDYQL